MCIRDSSHTSVSLSVTESHHQVRLGLSGIRRKVKDVVARRDLEPVRVFGKRADDVDVESVSQLSLIHISREIKAKSGRI